ncbi:hypothetical protein C1H46_038310 [Malus baccata]|uniref:Uncharacterized protein n=1 Tax=Malus baccata TaxID=106549 RepID=A0A540KPU0_MALBA|nr:hypothetical protein C1H46_038310 [Malus baccata]
MGSQVSSPRPNTPLPTSDHDYQGYRGQVTAANMENRHGAPQNLQRPTKPINSDEAARIYGGISVTEVYGPVQRFSRPGGLNTWYEKQMP